MKPFALALLLAPAVMVVAPAAQAQEVEQTSGRIAKIMKSGDGKSAETAYKVKSIGEEYQVMQALGYPRPEMQSLVFEKDKPYDVLTTTDPKTGEKVEVWFDISSFFGKGF
ncbi:MAG: DUF4919 domain-containing protein [Sphingomonas sp.]